MARCTDGSSEDLVLIPNIPTWRFKPSVTLLPGGAMLPLVSLGIRSTHAAQTEMQARHICEIKNFKVKKGEGVREGGKEWGKTRAHTSFKTYGLLIACLVCGFSFKLNIKLRLLN